MSHPALSSLTQLVLRQCRVQTNVCSRQHGEHGYRLHPRTVPDYNFLFVTRGQLIWEIENVEQPMGPQSLVLVRPGEPHQAWSITPRITFVSVHVDPRLPGGRDVFELLRPPRHQHVARHGWLDRYLRGALAEFDRGDEDARLMLPAWGRLITLEVLRCNDLAGLLTYRAIDPLVAELLEELSRRVEKPTTLEQLAHWAGFSPQHLNRQFQHELGVTPLKYLTRLRLERAADLLEAGELTVRGVARRCGFDDPAYFSRVFHQRFGHSPSRYQQLLGSKNPS